MDGNATLLIGCVGDGLVYVINGSWDDGIFANAGRLYPGALAVTSICSVGHRAACNGRLATTPLVSALDGAPPASAADDGRGRLQS